MLYNKERGFQKYEKFHSYVSPKIHQSVNLIFKKFLYIYSSSFSRPLQTHIYTFYPYFILSFLSILFISFFPILLPLFFLPFFFLLLLLLLFLPYFCCGKKIIMYLLFLHHYFFAGKSYEGDVVDEISYLVLGINYLCATLY